MLKCRDIATRASDYVDRNQTFMERLQVRAHLLICGNCRRFVRRLRTALRFFGALPSPRASEDQVAAIMGRVRGQ